MSFTVLFIPVVCHDMLKTFRQTIAKQILENSPLSTCLLSLVEDDIRQSRNLYYPKARSGSHGNGMGGVREI
jgi:hypothetical protein